MLHHLYFIIDAKVFNDPFSIKEKNQGILCFRYTEEGFPADFFNNLQNKKVSSFTFFLEENTGLDNKKAYNLISYFFHPQYLKENGSPILVIEKADNQNIEILIKEAKKQGFDNICIINLHQTKRSNSHLVSKASLIEDYTQILSNVEHPLEHIFVTAGSMEEVITIENIINQAENTFSNRHPLLFSILKENKEKIKHIEELKRKLKTSEDEISNLNKHLEIALSNSQSVALQNYYNNEYETLPSWYKRLGQIIKVIMGKRSFASLFNKRVKKYKD